MTTNDSKPLPRPAGILLAGLGVLGVALAVGGAPSCIIPDEGIVAMTECGIKWCITADSARGVKNGQITNIQEGGATPRRASA